MRLCSGMNGWTPFGPIYRVNFSYVVHRGQAGDPIILEYIKR